METVDKHIGARLRVLRQLAGMSNVDVAHALNLSLEKLEARERGEIRISASELFELSRLLKVEIKQFFEGL